MLKNINDITVSKKTDKQLLEALMKASSEKGVEHAYWNAISSTFQIPQPDDSRNTDGFIEVQFFDKKLFLLMEFKYKAQLNKRANSLRVLIQSLFYINNLKKHTTQIPNMVLIGDQEFAFVMNTKYLVKYLDYPNIDWSTSPSEAPKKYASTLLIDMENDGDIKFYPHKISSDFTFNNLLEDIKNIFSDTGQKIKLTESNITIAFERFVSEVIVDPSSFTAEELVSIFLTVAIERKNVYLSQSGSKLNINNKEISIKKTNYSAFISHFEEEYKPSEKRAFTAISDRLIFDLERRANGEFYTPSAFVKFSQSRLEAHLGKNWKNEFVVWDPAWGTGNLTRDEKFERLYASTLNQSDLDQAQTYNNNAEKFVFNFLEDDYNFEDDNLFQYEAEKLPQSLVNILVKQPLTKFLFYLNPPYATAGNANSLTKKSKKGVSKSKIQAEMQAKNLKVQEQLYAQFLYRIIKLKMKLNLQNVYIGLFSPTLFLTGSKFDKFRELFLSNFDFLEGNIFQASNFADVKGNWAIDFSIWKSNDSFAYNTKFDFLHNVLGINDIGEVQIIDKKILWNTDNPEVLSLQDYLKINTEPPLNETKKVIMFKSRFKTENIEVDIPRNAIGFLVNDTNNIEATSKGVYLMSSPIRRHIKTALITENTFDKQMMVFASRKVIQPNWKNQKDEFLAPDETHENFNSLRIKSVIYSIFSANNNIISYRTGYNGFNSDNLNPWFFMSPEEIRELADEFNNDEIYSDTISNSSNPYIVRFLKENHDRLDLNDKKIISLGKEIIRETFKFRNIFNDDNPQFSVNTWDASWNQINAIAKEYQYELLINFNNVFREYCDDIKDLVYSNGILKD